MKFILDNFDKLFDSEENLKKLEEIILDLAVKGKLVPQNPDDEPASVLIEKIKAEKEKLIKEKKIKKDKEIEPINEDEKPFEIPNSWEWVRLEYLYENISVKNNQIKTDEYLKEGVFPIVAQGKKLIEGFCDDDSKLLKINSPLIIFGDHTREVKYIDFDFVVGADGVKVMKPFIFEKYFFNVIKSYNLESRGYGRHFKILNEKLFPLPPLAEQKRIVEKIDSLKKLIDTLKEKAKVRDKTREELKKSIMAEIEKSDSNIDLLNSLEMVFKNFDTIVKNKEDIKDIRDLILSMAVKGKLVPQSSDDEPASVLLEKIKAEREKLIKVKKIKKDKELEPISEEEKPFEIPDSWEWVRLGEIIELLSGQDISVNECNSNKTGIPYIMGASNIQNEEIIIERWIEKPRVIGLENDILLSCKGTVGKTIIQNIPKAHLSRQIMGIRKIVHLDNKYLKLYIDSAIVKIKDKAQGLIPGISREDILYLFFPLPPLAEQKRIVEKVDKLMALCDDLEKKVEKSQKEFEKIIESAVQGVVEG